MSMLRIDLNCDMGEGAGHDAELMPHITSANIACGGHAGDAHTMRETLLLAQPTLQTIERYYLAIELLRQEVPYSTAVQIDEFRESATPVYIRATIYVERESQKGIVVGTGGAGIRELGAVSRRKIESFLDVPVYLDLWVKAKPGWRRRKTGLKQLGYDDETRNDGSG